MKHRVFIAINPPDAIKGALASYGDKWPELPCRWTKKDNLHITLEFLGYVDDEGLLEICKTTKDLVSKHNSFGVKLTRICYGPPGKMPPRMIWAIGDKINELNFSPHVTLGRIRTWQWKQIEPEERPDVSEEINLTFAVNSIEVMESVLGRGGPKYTILESFPLK